MFRKHKSENIGTGPALFEVRPARWSLGFDLVSPDFTDGHTANLALNLLAGILFRIAQLDAIASWSEV